MCTNCSISQFGAPKMLSASPKSSRKRLYGDLVPAERPKWNPRGKFSKISLQPSAALPCLGLTEKIFTLSRRSGADAGGQGGAARGHDALVRPGLQGRRAKARVRVLQGVCRAGEGREPLRVRVPRYREDTVNQQGQAERVALG